METRTFDREAMRIRVDCNNMTQKTLGARGLTAEKLKTLPIEAAAKPDAYIVK